MLTFGSLGVFIRESVGTSLGATSGFWKDGSWYCPPTVDVLEDVGLQTVEEYIRRRRQTVQSFTRHRPLYEACRRVKALATNINKAVWWQLEV